MSTLRFANYIHLKQLTGEYWWPTETLFFVAEVKLQATSRKGAIRPAS